MNLLMIEEMDTVIISALPKITKKLPVITVSPLDSSPFCIVSPGPGLLSMSVYSLETAPAWSFDMWLCALVEHEMCEGIADPLIAMLRIDRLRWPLEQRWRMINNLAACDIVVPLYSRAEAERVMMAMEVSREQ